MDEPDTPFDDHDEDFDDGEAVEAYAAQVAAAVEALGITPLEPGR